MTISNARLLHGAARRIPFGGKSPNPFHTLKIRSAIKGRREIDAVADTCSIGRRKYWKLHERFVPEACRIENQIKKGAAAGEPGRVRLR